MKEGRPALAEDVPTVSAAEAAERLGLSQPRVRELVREGRLRGEVTGRRLRIEESSVAAYKRLQENVLPQRRPLWY
jgi:excisionase family DNA binding protein